MARAGCVIGPPISDGWRKEKKKRGVLAVRRDIKAGKSTCTALGRDSAKIAEACILARQAAKDARTRIAAEQAQIAAEQAQLAVDAVAHGR